MKATERWMLEQIKARMRQAKDLYQKSRIVAASKSENAMTDSTRLAVDADGALDEAMEGVGALLEDEDN